MKPNDFIKMCKDAVEKVCEQGVASIGDKGGCAYLSKSGCCIVGHMMPDDETRREADKLEDSGVKAVICEGVWGHNMFTQHQEDILLSLQLVHDSYQDDCNENAIDVKAFREECHEILEKYEGSM